MNKKAFTPLMIFGLTWLTLTLVSWFALPDWQKIPAIFEQLNMPQFTCRMDEIIAAAKGLD